MHIDHLRVSCLKCKKVFDAEVVVNCPATVAVASMEAIRCPDCGSKCGMGGNYGDQPPLTASLTQRIGWWNSRGERGVSSNTIFSAIGYWSLPQQMDGIPYDPSDFRRCRQLFDLLPEWKSEMGKISKEFPYWEPFVREWSALNELYDLEIAKGDGKAPVLYKRIQELVEESSKLPRRPA